MSSCFHRLSLAGDLELDKSLVIVRGLVGMECTLDNLSR